jgi:hypothetical protein
VNTYILPRKGTQYCCDKENGSFRLELSSRLSTDASGIAACLDLQTNPRLELEEITKILKTKMSEDTLLTLQ